MEIKIDGQTIKLTPVQAEQFRKAILAETATPPPKYCGSMLITCKPASTKSSYRMVISSAAKTQAEWGCPAGHCGYDFGLTDVRGFIKITKEQAAKIWTTAEKELENV